MGPGVFPSEIMGVVGGHRERPCGPGQVGKVLEYPLFVLKTVVHELDEETIPAGKLLIVLHHSPGFTGIPRQEIPGHLSLEAGGAYDEPAGMFLQYLPVYPRFVVVTLQITRGGESHEVAVALLGCRKKRKVEIGGHASPGPFL